MNRDLYTSRGLIPIEKDVCDIADRIRALDEQYTVVYNVRLRRFEVHADDAFPSTYCLTVPSPLDVRAVVKTRMTRRERLAALIAEIDQKERV